MKKFLAMFCLAALSSLPAFGQDYPEKICDQVNARWGESWETQPTSASEQEQKLRDVSTAIACANVLYWNDRLDDFATGRKYLLHREICRDNPASHLAMSENQRDFYCNFSLHFRMCSTQGLYALKEIPDSVPRRVRDAEIFNACIGLSNELPYLKRALHLESLSDEQATAIIGKLYRDYKVKLGVRVPPASRNPVRWFLRPIEILVRTLFYAAAVPLEMVESFFSSTWHSTSPDEVESEAGEILRYRESLHDYDGKDLLDVSALSD